MNCPIILADIVTTVTSILQKHKTNIMNATEQKTTKVQDQIQDQKQEKEKEQIIQHLIDNKVPIQKKPVSMTDAIERADEVAKLTKAKADEAEARVHTLKAEVCRLEEETRLAKAVTEQELANAAKDEAKARATEKLEERTRTNISHLQVAEEKTRLERVKLRNRLEHEALVAELEARKIKAQVEKEELEVRLIQAETAKLHANATNNVTRLRSALSSMGVSVNFA